MVMINTPSNGGMQDMVGIHKDDFRLWLLGIDTSHLPHQINQIRRKTMELHQDNLNHHSEIITWTEETGAPFITQEIGEALYAASKGYYADNPPPDDSRPLIREHAKRSMATLVEHGLIEKRNMGRMAIYQPPNKPQGEQ